MRTMKPVYYILWLSLGLIAFSRNASGQNFVNLNFEQAQIVYDPSNYTGVFVRDAIPGWTVANNFQGTNDIAYNELSLGAPGVSLCGPGSKGGTSPTPAPLDGNFSIDLYGGVPGETYPQLGVSLSQTALVPASADSIRFIAEGTSGAGNGPLLVSLDGQNIPCSAISTEPNYTLYGGDISAFAGQIETLTFNAPIGVNNYWELDDIQFSSLAVPEPDVLSIFGIGALLFRYAQKLRRATTPGKAIKYSAADCEAARSQMVLPPRI